jgi:tetratricopeptide (TPR) repeat protein
MIKKWQHQKGTSQDKSANNIWLCFRWFVGCCILFSLFGINDVFAAPKPVGVVVLARPGNEVHQRPVEWLHRTLSDTLRERKLRVPTQQQVELALFSRPVPQADRADAQQREQAIKNMLAKAQRLYRATVLPLQKRCGYVLQIVNDASKEEDYIPKRFKDPELLNEIYLYYGLAHLGLGSKDEAVKYIEELIRLSPSFSPAKYQAPSDFIELYNTVLRRLRNRLFEMKVDTVPSGARVYHNYRFVGNTPITLSGLVAGRHSIRITKMKYLEWERVANFDPQRLGQQRSIDVKIPLTVDPELPIIEGVPIYDKNATYSDEIIDRLEAILNRNQAEYLYILDLESSANNTFQMQVAIYRKASRIIYYQTLDLGVASQAVWRERIKLYSRQVYHQVTTNYFKPRKDPLQKK